MTDSKEIDWGGNAFPTEGGTDSGLYPDPGMSLRDWFAGQALVEFAGFVTVEVPETFDIVARHCYRMADAMIAARKAGDA